MDKQTEIEAAVLRRLIAHLDSRKDVQNIELMNLAGFCRNCLSKWMMAEAEQRGVELDYDQAREQVYGMPYDEWKEKHQQKATPEQLEKFNQLNH
ncbi:MAG: DUF1244 domain-containing protein [Motiliproteus sp.]|nr:DUF1244 domain-containing protein [Motiliproteus sp.]MCW9052902.1 DUF1244 domain-containing protein [Motiliproteus sp.]